MSWQGEQEIARCAAGAGAEVHAFGILWPEGGIEGVRLAQDAVDALGGADIALFPIPGISTTSPSRWMTCAPCATA